MSAEDQAQASTQALAGAQTSAAQAPWLVVIDPQVIFAAQESAWASPMFAEAFANIERLAAAVGDRVLITRWLPTADRATSWGDYFAAWPFADRATTDPLFDLVPAAQTLSVHPTLDLPSFGKWGAELERRTQGAPVLLTGVSTDCCVLSTALAGVDAGGYITVVSDACAGSSNENHAAALQVMGLYSPQLTVATSDDCLLRLAASGGE